MANKFKYIWISGDGLSFSIPKRLQEEGERVYVALASNWGKDVAWGPQDDDDAEKAMLKRFKGMLDVKDVKQMLTAASGIKDKESYRVICDTNALYPIAEKFAKMGFKGLLPTEHDHHLESDREAGKDMVTELYDSLETAEHQEFKTVDEVEEFLEENEDKFYVAKGNDEDAPAVVPSVTRQDWNHKEIISSLRSKPEYENGGITLEEKIMDIVEFCPEAISYDGKIVGLNIDIENKAIGPGNVGFQTGDSASVSFWIPQGEIYEKFLQPLEKEMLRKNYLTYWDANVAYSPSRQTYYFLEYCPNRMGYNAIWNELATLPSVADYYERIFSGAQIFQPDVKKFGASVRIFNLKEDHDTIIQTEPNKDIWLIDAYKKGEDLFVAGFDENTAVVTGADDTLMGAFGESCANTRDFGYSKAYHRPMHDLMSYEYESSIPTRYNRICGLFPELTGEQTGDN